MLIDWPTVFFQIVNFLILIGLLKRFLYGPIIKAMDEREKKIADRLAQAAKSQKDAAAHASRLASAQEDFARNRNRMQQEAHLEIDKWKNESIERLKTEVEDQKKSWQQSLEEEKEAFLQKLKIAISQQVFQVARKAFTDLASEQLELRLIDTFLDKIDKEMDSAFRQDRDQKTVRIISGFPLQQTEKDRLQKGLSPFFSRHEQFHFEEDAGIGFGLRLLSGNHKWEWNLNRYMLDFEDEILKTMGMTK